MDVVLLVGVVFVIGRTKHHQNLGCLLCHVCLINVVSVYNLYMLHKAN